MALTSEIIKANAATAALTDEQIEAVVTLANNSEEELFRTKMGEHYRRLDASIEEHSGVPRNGDEKTYDYLPRAIDAMKASKDAELSRLREENKTLKEKGGDDNLRAQLESVNKELRTAKNEYDALKTQLDNERNENAKRLNDFKVDSEIARALDGVTFKSGINAQLLATAKEKAIEIIKGKNPTFEERGGQQRLVFHDGDNILLNKENKLEPYTAKELLVDELRKFDVVNVAPRKGAGGEDTPPSGGNSLFASTQVEAMAKIESLVGDKFSKGSADYQAEVNKMWSENKCSDLPLQ